MTYNECLSMLTEEEQEKFVANLKEVGDAKWVRFYENDSYPDMLHFIAAAFLWENSPEGTDYWKDVVSRF